MTVEIDRVRSFGDYFRGRLFLFLPNVCDARCAFCYVQPAVADHSHLPEAVLRRTGDLLSLLTEYGFDEVRLTGGEPLLLSKLDQLVELISGSGFRYTVLSNGSRLARWQDLFRLYPPSKVTVSVHSTSDDVDVFGSRWGIRDVLSAMASLASLTSVAATVVAVPSVLPHFRTTLSDLINAGVSELKLVQPNVPADRPSSAEFAELGRVAAEVAGPHMRVRMSDLNRHECILHREGQLSVSLPTFRFWSCCAKVGDDEFVKLDRFDNGGLGAVLEWARQQVFRSREALPCAAHYGACPIALASPA
jgi:organic radical activating enzyme